MKYVIFAAFSMFSLMASANDEVSAQAVDVQQYSYDQTLDVVKVIRIDTPESNLCEPVAASMLYLDSQGVEHELHYSRMSETCSTHG